MDSKATLLLGVHAVVGAAFIGFGLFGLLQGAAPTAAGLRILLGVLVVGLGYSVARIV